MTQDSNPVEHVLPAGQRIAVEGAAEEVRIATVNVRLHRDHAITRRHQSACTIQNILVVLMYILYIVHAYKHMRVD